MHAICLSVIAISLVLHRFAPGIYENPIVFFLGVAAILVELVWLFWLIMPVTMAGMHEDVARNELYGTRYKSRYRTQQIILVVIGLVIIAGFILDKAIFEAHEPIKNNRTPEEIIQDIREELEAPLPTPSGDPIVKD